MLVHMAFLWILESQGDVDAMLPIHIGRKNMNFTIERKILTNLLFMTGLSFFIGGLQRIENYFDKTFAQLIGVLLFLAVFSIVIPTAAHTLTRRLPRESGNSLEVLLSS
jgi:calcium/proton exchanger cax